LINGCAKATNSNKVKDKKVWGVVVWWSHLNTREEGCKEAYDSDEREKVKSTNEREKEAIWPKFLLLKGLLEGHATTNSKNLR
jgi:hypothetical protein